MGPAVDARQLESNLSWVQRAQQEGATLVCGGERVECATEGYFMSPALLVNTSNDMAINREEIFGPIACVIKVSDA
ncbi:aldehyde dehydrogenase family protein, partial [Pseudoalteromonas sp. SIMBA_162]